MPDERNGTTPRISATTNDDSAVEQPPVRRRYAGEVIGGRADTATIADATEILAGASGQSRFRRILPFLGPAFIAAIAYVDPGNFATNIEAGASYGYMLIWVIVASNLMAMLIQSLSAKLGIATGHNLAELIGRISTQTQMQSTSVTEVTKGMQGILRITEETTESTKQTNVSIGQLTRLAAELRSSVANFKV